MTNLTLPRDRGDTVCVRSKHRLTPLGVSDTSENWGKLNMVVFFPFCDKAINILYIEERFTKHLELKKTYVYKTRELLSTW